MAGLTSAFRPGFEISGLLRNSVDVGGMIGHLFVNGTL